MRLLLLPPLLLCAAVPFAACTNSPGTSVSPDAAKVMPDSSTTLANIAVSVGYAGTKHGSVVVAAFRSFPPMGPPSAFQTVDMPTFPAMVTLRDLEAGTYYVVGMLDVAPASPTSPGPEDLQAVSAPLMLSSTPMSVALTLHD
jgi:hypothetical protein